MLCQNHLRPHSFTHSGNLNAHVLDVMEHSAAILNDAKNTVEAAAQSASADQQPTSSKMDKSEKTDDRRDDKAHNNDRNKRKRDFKDSSMQHGSRGRGRNDNKRHKKGDMGRSEYLCVHRIALGNH